MRRSIVVSSIILPIFILVGAPSAARALSVSCTHVRGNAWWVETDVSANEGISGVQAHNGDGAWEDLAPTAWGSWAKSFFVTNNTIIEFRVKGASNTTVLCGRYLWPSIQPVASVEPTPPPPPPPPPPPADDPDPVLDPTPPAPANSAVPSRYSPKSLHSPISQSVANSVREIVSHDRTRQNDVFMKVGDSISSSPDFLNCFVEDSVVDLGNQQNVAAPLQYFRAAHAAGTSSFARRSLAVRSGMNTPWVLTGSPSPLRLEYNAINPRFAVVMFGTNDLSYAGDPRAIRSMYWRWYAQNLADLVDELSDEGIVPIMSTIPMRTNRANFIGTMNAVIRATAQARQIPLMEYYSALAKFPNYAIRSDGLHPTIYRDRRDIAHPCVLNDTALNYGMNVRNWLTLQALERVRQVALNPNAAPPDAASPPLAGAGTAASPLQIDTLPFSDQDNRTKHYSLHFANSTHLRVLAVARRGYDACRNAGYDCTGIRDLKIDLTSRGSSGETTLASHPTMIETQVNAGDYRVTVTPQNAQEYLVVVLECDSDDARCN